MNKIDGWLNIAFFTYSEWAFGSIHYELCKYLFNHKINANVLNWNIKYSQEEITELDKKLNYFVGTPHGIAALIDKYNIKPEKCIVVVHALSDIHFLSTFSQSNLERLYGYGAVSQWLIEQSKLTGLKKIPTLVPIGINYNSYYCEPNKQLSNIGYAGIIEGPYSKIKRYWLIEEISKQTQLPLIPAILYHNSFVTMQGYYKTVDTLIVASTHEGAGLPALEASAAGKLVISTPVGTWLEKSGNSGHTVPIKEQEFIEETITLLTYYKNNPDSYIEKCLATQEHATLYDWSNVIHHWVNLIK